MVSYCLNWVWAWVVFHLPRSRGSTLRSKTCPLGRCDSEVVQEANIMVGRLMILLMICSAKKVWWILEQPHSSIMHYHPLFQRFLQLRGVEVRKLFTCMGWFGAGSKKPTHLYSSGLTLVFGVVNPKSISFALPPKQHRI